ncbi:RNA recognition motif domain-containing protein [Cinnamomum micranthum f. kanehirae]|uniref:RNA recognition motif domain-containing protein n=1 Tax=Cinnamomum micranthum f. kanehirae TaxID=337451 RepID=A0A443P1V6_9MAGN|nr:RNA recognition motif domain-containing protein [Cinnamomum micranthum f. kanehirae]
MGVDLGQGFYLGEIEEDDRREILENENPPPPPPLTAIDLTSKKHEADENGIATFESTSQLTPKDARKILEPFATEQLLEIFQDAVACHPDILDAIRNIANRDPSNTSSLSTASAGRPPPTPFAPSSPPTLTSTSICLQRPPYLSNLSLQLWRCDYFVPWLDGPCRNEFDNEIGCYRKKISVGVSFIIILGSVSRNPRRGFGKSHLKFLMSASGLHSSPFWDLYCESLVAASENLF